MWRTDSNGRLRCGKGGSTRLTSRAHRLRTRSLRLEPLESRTLLSVNVLDTSFKTAELAGTVDFSGTYTEGLIRVSFRGHADAQAVIDFQGPEQGAGWIAATGTGTYRSVLGSGTAEFAGRAEGEYDAGVVTGTASGWIDISGMGRYEKTVSGTFEFNPFDYRGSWSYEQDGLSVRGTIKLQPTSDAAFNVAYTDVSWIDPANPLQGVNLTVEVAGPVHMPGSSATTVASSVNLFWGRGASLYSRTARLPDSIPIYWNQAGGSYTVTDLPAMPSGTTHLLVVAQYDGKTSLQALPVPPAPTPKVSIKDVEVVEGDSGVQTALFTVSLSEPTTRAVTVRYATASGTAKAWSDFKPVYFGTVAIPAHQTEATISVRIIGDRKVEGNETFLVNLLGARYATIDDRQAVGTIVDNDGTTTPARDAALQQLDPFSPAWADLDSALSGSLAQRKKEGGLLTRSV